MEEIMELEKDAIAPRVQSVVGRRLPDERAIYDALKDVRQAHAEDEIKKELTSKGSRLYTPAMLRRFLEWTGETCAFPLCDEPQMKPSGVHYYENTNWHLCVLHKKRFDNVRGVEKWKKKHGRTDTTTPENRRAIIERHKRKKEMKNGITASGTPHAELGTSQN